MQKDKVAEVIHMDWLGIGVFILSIGFAVMVFYLIPVFKNLTRTLGATADTITSTEKELEKITNETTSYITYVK
ncbi:MAG: DUF948 domain-containing protein [Bacillus sp. (in: Bacteria)]|nr:DUF948 domain-containing protein [Bacillus sp. (in: firmicutes)]